MQPDVSQCPRCALPLHQDFGFVNCSKCGTAMMISFDGQISVFSDSDQSSRGGSSEMPENSYLEIPERPISSSGDSDLGGDNAFHFENQSKPEVPDQFSVSDIHSSDDQNLENPDSEFADFNVHDSPSMGETSTLVDTFLGDKNSAEHEPMGGYFESLDNPPAASSDEFEPISDYAASDRSSAREGLYLYTLVVSGVDTLEMEDELRSMLEDSRLGLDAEAIIKKIDSGVASIESIGPVKASIIVNRMRETLLTVSWTQVSILQESP